MTAHADVPAEIVAELRSGCLALPEAYEESAWVLDADTDWSEVAELVTESYCALAPKKLVALVHRPTD